ncbi:MAG TPA: nuclear transport factor 2 family protein [Candidatus Kapabacteria bacterium]|nr:nuclear transport factor 2 family protein [Candidatus Kapabacteria bacterium]
MSPKELVTIWVERFNAADHSSIAELYAEDAVNHQMPLEAVIGREAIAAMFKREFASAEMICIPIQILEEGEWAVLEWSDPLGLQGCGFFQVKNDKIVMQRGYWDRLSFEKLNGLR